MIGPLPDSRAVRTVAGLGLVALCLAGTCPGAAQAPAPLRKSDLIRLLSNPLIQAAEVVEVVRRDCLAFQPTERDWADLRSLGADGDLLNSVGECATRRAQRAAPTGPLPSGAAVVTVLTPHVAAAVGGHALAQVQLRRANGTAVRGVAVRLRPASPVSGGPAAEMGAVADDSGFALFDVAVGRRPGTYQLQLVSGAGTPLPGRPMIDLVVSAAAPAAAQVLPSRLELSPLRDTTVALLVTLRDSFGNAVPQEPLELRPGSSGMGVTTSTAATDSFGRATFIVRPAAVRRSGQLEVRARGVTLAALGVVIGDSSRGSEAAPLPGVKATFIHSAVLRGLAWSRLVEPLTFEVRSSSGVPLPGQQVAFRAVNAQVEPTNAVTDSGGRVRLQVRLGAKAGPAEVTAVVDSVQKSDTLEVEPGGAVDLVLEREGQRVDGARILVERGVPFELTLRARDRFGNAVSVATLTGYLQKVRGAYNARRDRLLDLVGVRPEGTAAVLTFKPVRLGDTELTIDVGLPTGVFVEVVPRSK